mmetsp:Transcript_56929/g.184412  ORF Transcript_56929/g.184412 Transcript_56929/m.184412 type:complete len:359 (+) Transcript_56929:76-1152(+)
MGEPLRIAGGVGGIALSVAWRPRLLPQALSIDAVPRRAAAARAARGPVVAPRRGARGAAAATAALAAGVACGVQPRFRRRSGNIRTSRGSVHDWAVVDQDEDLHDEDELAFGSPLGPLLNLLGISSQTTAIASTAQGKIRSVVLMLRRHAQQAMADAEQAKQERDVALALAEERAKEVTKVKKLVQYMSKYSEEVEDERDTSRKALEDQSTRLALLEERLKAASSEEWDEAVQDYKRITTGTPDKVIALEARLHELEERLRSADADRWAEVARGVENALLGGSKQKTALTADEMARSSAEDGAIEPPAVTAMNVQDLQWECVLRSLPTGGGLPVLRSRVRAARARDRVAAPASAAASE